MPSNSSTPKQCRHLWTRERTSDQSHFLYYSDLIRRIFGVHHHETRPEECLLSTRRPACGGGGLCIVQERYIYYVLRRTALSTGFLKYEKMIRQTNKPSSRSQDHLFPWSTDPAPSGACSILARLGPVPQHRCCGARGVVVSTSTHGECGSTGPLGGHLGVDDGDL